MGEDQAPRADPKHEEELLLWPSRATRDGLDAEAALIERYLPYARSIALRLYQSRPDNDVPFEDYFQWASLGLIEAVKRFDERQGVAFSTFATLRIRGAVLNGLDKATERRERAAFVRRNRRERVESVAEGAAERPSSSLFSEMVDLTLQLAVGFLIEDTGVADAEKIKDTSLESRALDELRTAIRNIVDALPDRERLVIRYHYFYRVGFGELADQLGVTKGRISQIHKQALNRIREGVGARNTGLDDYL